MAAQRAVSSRVSSLHRDLDVVLGMCVFTAAVRPNRWFDMCLSSLVVVVYAAAAAAAAAAAIFPNARRTMSYRVM